MCGVRLFAVTSRNALSWPPTSVGYHRCRHRHLAHVRKHVQRIAWLGNFGSTPGRTYVDYRKENAHFPGDRSIAHILLLRSIVQNTWLKYYPSHIMAPIRELYLIGSYSYMGFREL